MRMHCVRTGYRGRVWSARTPENYRRLLVMKVKSFNHVVNRLEGSLAHEFVIKFVIII